jgi:hypothetical protein
MFARSLSSHLSHQRLSMFMFDERSNRRGVRPVVGQPGAESEVKVELG